MIAGRVGGWGINLGCMKDGIVLNDGRVQQNKKKIEMVMQQQTRMFVSILI